MKYRPKKSFDVEAWCWNGAVNTNEMPEWLVNSGNLGSIDFSTGVAIMWLVKRNYYKYEANIGDYIICNEEGKIFPMKPDTFAASYEAVSE